MKIKNPFDRKKGGSTVWAAVVIVLLAVLLEVTVFSASFWKTFGNEGTAFLTSGPGIVDGGASGSSEKAPSNAAQLEMVFGHVDMEDMDSAPANWSDGEVYADEDGFTHVSAGEILIRLIDLDCPVEQLALNLSLPEEGQAKVSVFMRDEGNAYTYQLGGERTIWEWKSESKAFLVYPYGEVQDIFIRLQTVSAGQELVYQLDGVTVNGRMSFSFSVPRVLIVAAALFLIYGLSERSGLSEIQFWPECCEDDGGQSRAALHRDEALASGSRRQKKTLLTAAAKKRLPAVAACALALTFLSVLTVLANPTCRQNLGMHHAQYQELAQALVRGETWVGTADERLLEVENPYDTIYLQANQIPYQADYAYKDGKYYVYFGVVPELLCYLPFYLLTGKNLPNYLAMLFFCAGFVFSCAGLVYELMRGYFPKAPFYLYPVCVFMLGFGYPLFYMQLRPDLYHVPIAASCMFTALSLWLILTGCRCEKRRAFLWGAGALCMALNAGCRPQFLLFSLLLLPLCGPWLLEMFRKKTGGSEFGEKAFSGAEFGERLKTLLAMALPYIAVAAGIMYYNAVRFGSPFDFGATYSMTSNDMTHRGFNLSRILYSAWYYLFEPLQLEGVFPYLRSASIEGDYMGRLVSESCFGGIFACGMLYWPLFAAFRGRKRLKEKKLAAVVFMSAFIALIICAADASGAGILQRYMADQMFGFALAAVVALLVIVEWAQEKGVYQHFAGWLTAALLIHVAFLALVLINMDSSINISAGNPGLYAAVWSLLQF